MAQDADLLLYTKFYFIFALANLLVLVFKKPVSLIINNCQRVIRFKKIAVSFKRKPNKLF